ncbi:LacI family DNA-binding transcriptional regulator [Luteococcus sp. H138]|uniref:LacI family DNA-binding transcriptional regulator n=1 Tax=unclassified Luteococcus TaxID=2639923 RepID=UPI00313A7AE2
MGRPTLVSLAKELGVSRQTVSNVINAPHLVKSETRERVQEAIERSGYRPNQAAQALRNQRSRTVAMRVYPTLDEGINGAVMDRFVHRFAQALRDRGYALLLVTADSDEDEVDTLHEMSIRGRIDGCLLTGTYAGDPRPAQLAAEGAKLVAFGRPWGQEETSTHDWVDIDGAAGTRMATQHLLDAGYRRIGFLGWPEGSGVGDDRRRGWAETLGAAGVDGFEAWQATGMDTMATGLSGMETLLGLGAEAVVCAADSLAVGAVEHLRRSGLMTRPTAPVIGFDNTPVARAMGISSIDQDVERAVQALTDRLMLRVGDGSDDLPPLNQLLAPRLVTRELSSIFVTH